MGAVTLEADIAATKARLLAAESARDSARLYGTQEKYRQSCSLVEALVREVERLVLMNRFGIRFDGVQYQYGDRRYERLAEAMSYARLHLGLPAADAE
jgi:hypothetical protein